MYMEDNFTIMWGVSLRSRLCYNANLRRPQPHVALTIDFTTVMENKRIA